MGIKQAIEQAFGWMVANGTPILIALGAIAVGGLILWALPRGAEIKFGKTDAGAGYKIIARVKVVERDEKKLKQLLKKSRGSWPYMFAKAEDKQAAAEDYKVLADHITRENEAIDAFLGVSRDGEAV